MRYKLLVCVFVLLIATPILAQESSPIIVETGKPMPSVIKSGEPFKVTYRAKFLDTVVIKEEDMQPGDLALEKFEVIGLEINKNTFNRPKDDNLGFVNVWDFIYTFRIIQPEKGEYKIPPFNFYWVPKKAGTTEEEAKEKEKPREFLTEEVGIVYVSSIAKPPFLDIRDEIGFILPISDGIVWRRWAYGVMGAASLLVLIILFRFVRYSDNRQSQVTKEDVGVEASEDGVMVVGVGPIFSPKQARSRFFKEIKKMQSEAKYPILDLEKKLRFLARELLLAELRETIRDSMSENEIYAKLTGLDVKHKKLIGSKYAVMVDLARRLKRYQEDIDLGTCTINIVKEVVELRVVVSGLSFYKRFLFFVKNLFGRRR